jgi:hypothetical protein
MPRSKEQCAASIRWRGGKPYVLTVAEWSEWEFRPALGIDRHRRMKFSPPIVVRIPGDTSNTDAPAANISEGDSTALSGEE